MFEDLAEANTAAERIATAWAQAARDSIPLTSCADAHTHIGEDSDGSTLTAAQLTRQLDQSGVSFALTTALHHGEGYDVANPEVIEWTQASGGRLLPLWRIDPGAGDGAGQARRGFAAGAVGLKFHPRAEQFAMTDPQVRAAVAVAASEGAVVLIHAGRGMAALGEETVALAGDYADATFILAHAAISDLAWIGPQSRDIANLAFDTSWWSPIDLAALLSAVDPAQVVFGSDPPYGQVASGLTLACRVARSIGYGSRQLAALFGGNLVRMLGARRGAAELASEVAPSPLDVGTDWKPTVDRPLASWALRRCAGYLANAMAVGVAQGDSSEAFELAELSLAVPDSDPSAPEAHALRRVVHVARAQNKLGDRRAAMRTAVLALSHAATAELGISAVDIAV